MNKSLRAWLMKTVIPLESLLFDNEPNGGGGNPPPPAQPSPPAPPPYQRQPQQPRDTELEDLRAESAARRIAAKDAESQRDAARQAAREADERAARAANEAEVKYKPVLDRRGARLIEAELKAEAAAAGIRDIDLVPLIRNGAQIIIDEADNVIGVKEAVEAFKAKKPEYFRSEAPPPPAGNPPPAAPAQRPPVGMPGNPPPANPTPPPRNVTTLERPEYTKSLADARATLRARAR